MLDDHSALAERLFLLRRGEERDPHLRPTELPSGTDLRMVAERADTKAAFNRIRKRAMLPIQLRDDLCFWFRDARQLGSRICEGALTLDKNVLGGVPAETWRGIAPLDGPVPAPVDELVLHAPNVGNFFVSTIRTAGRPALAARSFSNHRDMRLSVLSRRGEPVKPYLRETIELLYAGTFAEIRFIEELDIGSFICPINPVVPGSVAAEGASGGPSRRVLRSSCDIADAIRGLPRPGDSPARGRILISRRNAKTRKIANEDALLGELAPLGFVAVCMEDLSLREQMTMVAEAEIVIGPHGAGMAHMVSARPGASFIELSSRQYAVRAVNNFAPVAQAIGVAYHILYCDEDGDHTAELVENEGNDIIVGPQAMDQIARIVAEQGGG